MRMVHGVLGHQAAVFLVLVETQLQVSYRPFVDWLIMSCCSLFTVWQQPRSVPHARDFDILRRAWGSMSLRSLVPTRAAGECPARRGGVDLAIRPDELLHWDSREVFVHEWLLNATWSLCPSCRVFHPRTLSARELVSGWTSIESRCWSCSSSKLAYSVPQLSTIPEILRGLSAPVNQALAPLTLHQGSPRRHKHGYFRKDTLSHLSWKQRPVVERLQGISDPAEWERGRRAFAWLCEKNYAYLAWVKQHEEICVSSERLSLPTSSLLEPFVESALWPHLYPLPEWCESSAWGASWSAPGDRTDRKSEGYASSKATFCRKVPKHDP